MLRSANLHHRAKFRTSRSNRSGDMAVYWFFKMAVVRHLRLSKLANFNCLIPLGGPKCVILPNFVQIGQTIAEIWPFFDFQDGGHPPSWIFNFQNFNHPCPSEVQNASWCQTLCKSVEALLRYGRFLFFKMAAILDFQNLEILTAYTNRRANMYHLAKFCTDRLNRCRDMAVFRFSRWRPSAILDF